VPKDPKDLAKAKTCASDGIKFIDQALALDPNSESAWSYKASLLIQTSRLAEMQQQATEKAHIDKEVLAAKAQFTKLADAARDRQAQADREEQERWKKERPTVDSNIASMAKFIASGRLVKKVSIDESSIDSRDMELMVPPEDPDRTQQPKPDPPAPPIVWKTVTPPDGTFSFILPSQFDLAGTMYSATGEGMIFLLTYIDLPANHPPATAEEIIGGTASAMADSVCAFSLLAKASCEVRLAKKISLGSYPGIEYTVAEDNCIKVLPGLLRVYATPNRVYALAAIGGDETDPPIAKFLNSFSVKK
ncbi:MAG TPA: hypothetical protein VEV84_08360, partial [Pyrinomonadaceae bacterium]|nr:hypothetical protein [Pyrinomonadaceae bacterium]